MLNLTLKSVNIRKYPYSVQVKENTVQKRLRIWTLFTRCSKRCHAHITQQPYFRTRPKPSKNKKIRIKYSYLVNSHL